MRMLRSCAVLGAAVLAMMTMAARADAMTVFTTTFTISGDSNSDALGTSSISGAYGTQFFSNGVDVIFSTIQVNVSDQGENHSYDFSYHCRVGTPGCTTAPTVFSQYSAPGASNFAVKYTINEGELPPCLFPKLGQTTSCSGEVHTSVSDFVFVTSGRGFLTETNSFKSVPEPAAWALMLMGFGGLGAMLRRRRALPA